MVLRVQCYGGRKADERPMRFQLGERDYVIEEVLDQWYSPDDTFFKVRADLWRECRRWPWNRCLQRYFIHPTLADSGAVGSARNCRDLLRQSRNLPRLLSGS